MGRHLDLAEAAEADQAEAEDPADPADPADPVAVPVADLCAGAKSALSALKKLPILTTKRLIKLGVSCLNGLRLSPAAAPESAPNISAPCAPLSSGPGRSPWCHSWPTTPTQAASAAERIQPNNCIVLNRAAQAQIAPPVSSPFPPQGKSRLDNAISLARQVRRC